MVKDEMRGNVYLQITAKSQANLSDAFLAILCSLAAMMFNYCQHKLMTKPVKETTQTIGNM
jgi:hypothetical protein